MGLQALLPPHPVYNMCTNVIEDRRRRNVVLVECCRDIVYSLALYIFENGVGRIFALEREQSDVWVRHEARRLAWDGSSTDFM